MTTTITPASTALDAPAAPADVLTIDALPATADAHPGGVRYRPLAFRAGLVQGVIVGGLVVELTFLVVLRRALDGHLVYAAADTARWALLAAVLAGFPALALWAHRAASNLGAIGARDIPFPPSRAAWCWFVPLANLVLPLPVLVTLSQASHPEYAPRSDLWRASPKRPLVPAFWAAHVVSIIVGLVLRGSVHSASSFWLTNGGMALVFSVDLLACGLGIAVVRQVSGDQRHRATRLARAGLLPEGLTDHART